MRASVERLRSSRFTLWSNSRSLKPPGRRRNAVWPPSGVTPQSGERTTDRGQSTINRGPSPKDRG